MKKRALLAMAKMLLSDLGCNEADLSILITDDKEIRRLNKRYRGKNKATDVLSFPLSLPGGVGRPFVLGDVVISLDTTRIQAKDQHVSVSEEFLRLLIHGVLHLLGFDHENVPRGEAERMRRKERILFRKLSQGKGNSVRLRGRA